ncbi:unnamed protein product [Tuber aestivum]|uniref:Uncharacterized protein n=1 Tax=Tuber aestivum TaxID=59557 RepID=A0A292PQK4_9PEZI|nr:unnamed protein product [Tuber aestivum]
MISAICLTYLGFDLSPTPNSVPRLQPAFSCTGMLPVLWGYIPDEKSLRCGTTGYPSHSHKSTGLHGAGDFGLQVTAVALLVSEKWDINAIFWKDNTQILRAARGVHDKVLNALFGCRVIGPDTVD